LFSQIPIGFCHYYINRSPEYFHEPEKFNPDRWWRDSNNISPFAAIPFGFGARMCPGRRVAELELLVALHWICRRFRLESVVTTEVKQKLNAMLVPDGPLPIRFLDRC
jgi:cytochrome P450